jgi:hypothetical protein
LTARLTVDAFRQSIPDPSNFAKALTAVASILSIGPPIADLSGIPRKAGDHF